MEYRVYLLSLLPSAIILMMKNKLHLGWMVGLLVLCLAFMHPGIGRGDVLPEDAYIAGVIGHVQGYSLSCEARSAVDWAAFWGVNINESEFIANLLRSDNPDTGFVGYYNDPWGYIPPHSYGVHAGPVAALLRDYGLQAEARRGLAWDDLRAEVAAGRPVIVWIIGQMWNGTPLSYVDSNGQAFTVAYFEHTMVLVGYNTTTVFVVDAYSGASQTYYLSTFLSSWAVLGNMAILGEGSRVSSSSVDTQPGEDIQAGSSPSTPGTDTYLVQKGDYLLALAERFNIDWQELTALNDIPYPYMIYPGQVLKVPAEVIPTSHGTPPTELNATANPVYIPLVFGSLLTSEMKESEPASSSPETYTVRRGDFLIELAGRFGQDWQTLAFLNNIQYPYVIYPGQVLKLR